jgi:hypothetical protein
MASQLTSLNIKLHSIHISNEAAPLSSTHDLNSLDVAGWLADVERCSCITMAYLILGNCTLDLVSFNISNMEFKFLQYDMLIYI